MEEHDTELRELTSVGSALGTHVEPPLDDSSATGPVVGGLKPETSSKSPTATQSFVDTHATELRLSVVLRLPSAVHVEPAFVLEAKSVPTFWRFDPTATHTPEDVHETEFNGATPVETVLADHVEPPLVDSMAIPMDSGPPQRVGGPQTTSLPTATQSFVVTHETELRPPVIPAGREPTVHVAPPFVLKATDDEPTATQSLIEGHDTD
jgi:hypothetical protein